MKLSATKCCTHAFTIIELMIVSSIIGLLAVIAFPAYGRSRAQSAEMVCIRNLRQMESAKSQWALEARKEPGATPKDANLFGLNGYIRVKPTCPSGGSYELNKVKEAPTCTVPGHFLD